MHAAQKRIKGDAAQLMKQPNTQWTDEGYLSEKMVEAGWKRDRVTVFTTRVEVSGNDLEGLRGFMCGDFTRIARDGWTEDEKGRWQEAIDEAIEDVKIKEGTEGLPVEAWVVVAERDE